MYHIHINRNEDRYKFLNWIYEDCNIYLERKYKKYLDVKLQFTQDCLAV